MSHQCRLIWPPGQLCRHANLATKVLLALQMTSPWMNWGISHSKRVRPWMTTCCLCATGYGVETHDNCHGILQMKLEAADACVPCQANRLLRPPQSMERQKLNSKPLLSGMEWLVAAVPLPHSTSTALLGACGVACTEVCLCLPQDMERQKLNVFRMRLLGAEVRPVNSGTATLKDATSEAIRDWVTNCEDTHYILGSAAGPHPYPMMVSRGD